MDDCGRTAAGAKKEGSANFPRAGWGGGGWEGGGRRFSERTGLPVKTRGWLPPRVHSLLQKSVKPLSLNIHQPLWMALTLTRVSGAEGTPASPPRPALPAPSSSALTENADADAVAVDMCRLSRSRSRQRYACLASVSLYANAPATLIMQHA